MKRFCILLILLCLTAGAAAQGGFPREIVDDAGRKKSPTPSWKGSCPWLRATPKSSSPSERDQVVG